MKVCVWILSLFLPSAVMAQNITTVAGNGMGGDGTPAVFAQIYDPCGLAFDKHGNLYFATNLGNQIRKIDAAGIITTVAGTGVAGFSGDSDLASTPKLNQPVNIALDTAGNIFIADAGNNRVRKINMTTSIITTVAGNGIGAFGGDNGSALTANLNTPSGLCFDSFGNLYIADYANFRVRKVNVSGVITTVGGNGLSGCSGDGGQATNAKCIPIDIRVDKNGNIYFVNWGTGTTTGGGTIRKINPSGVISTIAGDTTSYVYNSDGMSALEATMNPQFLTLDNEETLYLSDYTNNRIRKVGADGIIHTIAGNGIGGNTGDNGPATEAEIHYPGGLAFDSCGNLYFGQVNTPRIRKISFNPYCFPTNVWELSASNGIVIYPNPNQNRIIINANKITSISLINILGKIVFSQQYSDVQKAEIDIGHLPSGLYTVKVNEQYVQKLVKE